MLEKSKVVRELASLYAGYQAEAQKPGQREKGMAAQAAISQVMLRLGLVEDVRQFMSRPRVTAVPLAIFLLGLAICRELALLRGDKPQAGMYMLSIWVIALVQLAVTTMKDININLNWNLL